MTTSCCAAACAGALLVPAGASAADIPATPATFGAAFASARPGDRIVLAAGDYGRFTGGMKPGVVTIKGAPGVASSMTLDFDPASNLVIDGLTLRGAELRDARTRNITVRNSVIRGQTVFRTGELANASILFDRNVHPAWDECSGCGEGRVYLPEKTGQPSGITIQNSRFGPGGDSDGIQNGSNGTRIVNNEFVGIKQLPDGSAHADSIQLYGSRNTVIRGNWFHDVSVGIMAPDGADHEVIEDNVIQATSPYAINLKSDDGTIVRHNTLPDGRCEYNQRCGKILLGAKSGNPSSRGTVIRDNILSEIVWGGQTAAEDYNLFAVRIGRGAHDARGLPRYIGGAAPTSYAGFALAAGSAGKGNAGDGLDRGARFLPAQGPPADSRLMRPGVRLLSGKRALRKRGRVRLRVRAAGRGTVVLAAAIRPQRRPRVRPVRVKPRVLRFTRAGARNVSLRLSRDARRRVRSWRRLRVVVVTFGDVQRQPRSGRFVFTVR